MTLGSGALHSEQNASPTEPMRFIQIWIMPAERGLTPGVEQKVFTEADRTNRLLRAISGDGGDAVLVHQDAHMFVSHLDPGVAVTHPLGDGRGVYLYVIEGDVTVNGEPMATGDAAEIEGGAGGRDRGDVGVRAHPGRRAALRSVPSSLFETPPSGLRRTPKGGSSGRLT